MARINTQWSEGESLVNWWWTAGTVR